MSARAELAAILTRALPRGVVLAVGAEAYASALGAWTVREADSIAGGAEPNDAVLIGALGEPARSMARAAASSVRPGGAVVFAIPTTRPGFKGTTGSLLGMLRKQRPVELEELCEALLAAGLEDIEARELRDAAGTSLVWARAPRT